MTLWDIEVYCVSKWLLYAMNIDSESGAMRRIPRAVRLYGKARIVRCDNARYGLEDGTEIKTIVKEIAK